MSYCLAKLSSPKPTGPARLPPIASQPASRAGLDMQRRRRLQRAARAARAAPCPAGFRQRHGCAASAASVLAPPVLLSA